MVVCAFNKRFWTFASGVSDRKKIAVVVCCLPNTFHFVVIYGDAASKETTFSPKNFIFFTKTISNNVE